MVGLKGLSPKIIGGDSSYMDPRRFRLCLVKINRPPLNPINQNLDKNAPNFQNKNARNVSLKKVQRMLQYH